MLEIDILRNSLQILLGVLKGEFLGFECPNDAQTPSWLRLYHMNCNPPPPPQIPFWHYTPSTPRAWKCNGSAANTCSSLHSVSLHTEPIILDSGSKKNQRYHFRLVHFAIPLMASYDLHPRSKRWQTPVVRGGRIFMNCVIFHSLLILLLVLPWTKMISWILDHDAML